MKSITRHVGVLQVIQREPSSRNGNPRYLVSLDGYVAKTGVDSALGYSITNFDGKRVSALIGLVRGVVTIENVKIENEEVRHG